MPSFDIVCEIDDHEVNNAIDQANREVGTRFDFKGVKASFAYAEPTITMKAENDFQLKQMLDILGKKMSKRGVDLEHMKLSDPVLQNQTAQQTVTLQKGITTETGKKITKLIKNEKMKVQASIQGDQVRVTGKKRDDLQEVIELMRAQSLGLPLQFVNFRD